MHVHVFTQKSDQVKHVFDGPRRAATFALHAALSLLYLYLMIGARPIAIYKEALINSGASKQRKGKEDGDKTEYLIRWKGPSVWSERKQKGGTDTQET